MNSRARRFEGMTTYSELDYCVRARCAKFSELGASGGELEEWYGSGAMADVNEEGASLLTS